MNPRPRTQIVPNQEHASRAKGAKTWCSGVSGKVVTLGVRKRAGTESPGEEPMGAWLRREVSPGLEAQKSILRR